MKYLLSSAAVIAILAGTSALAANDKTTTNVRPPVSVDFVNAQTKQDWLSANLVGASVENPQGESLGDINNIVITESGDIKAVIIGVGGFLGIGEKDVGVRFNALTIKHDEHDEKTAMQADQTADRMKQNKQTSAQPMNEKTMPQAGRMSPSERAEERHDDFVIVLNATKEQLEKAPEFTYLGEQNKQTNNDVRKYSEKSSKKKTQ